MLENALTSIKSCTLILMCNKRCSIMQKKRCNVCAVLKHIVCKFCAEHTFEKLIIQKINKQRIFFYLKNVDIGNQFFCLKCILFYVKMIFSC